MCIDLHLLKFLLFGVVRSQGYYGKATLNIHELTGPKPSNFLFRLFVKGKIYQKFSTLSLNYMGNSILLKHTHI